MIPRVFYLLINDCGIYCLLRQHIHVWSFSICLCNYLHFNQTYNKNNKKSFLPVLMQQRVILQEINRPHLQLNLSLEFASLQQDLGSAAIIQLKRPLWFFKENSHVPAQRVREPFYAKPFTYSLKSHFMPGRGMKILNHKNQHPWKAWKVLMSPEEISSRTSAADELLHLLLQPH